MKDETSTVDQVDPKDDQKKYELMVIIKADIGEDAAKKRLDEIKKLIARQKGEIFFDDVWGLRDLAYSIKKHERGFYAVLNFMMLPEMLREIDSTLRLEPEVLRHMLVVLPFKYTPKTLAVMEEEAKVKDEARKLEEKPGRGRPMTLKPKEAVVAKPPMKEEPKVEAAKEDEAKPKKTAAKKEEKKETSLEDVDAKLKSIIDNPDINF